MVKGFDQKDKKILHELDYNSRQPISKIARKTRLSRDTVEYRIRKFLQNKVIFQFYTIIDIAKLGYAAYKNFIRFQNISEKKEKEFIQYLKNHPNVVYSASYDGRFDIVISIWAKDINHLNSTLKEIYSRYGKYIAERKMAAIIRGEYCVKDYLLGKKTTTKRKPFIGSIPRKIKIDMIDWNILFHFGMDSRIPAIDIANKLNVSADTIAKRIRRLEKNGIIQHYNFVPDERGYPYFHHKILVTLHELNEKIRQTLFEYCRQNNNIWFFCSALGEWNFEIDMDIENKTKFRQFLREFRNKFSDMIKDYTVLTAYRTNKYNFCPSLPKEIL